MSALESPVSDLFADLLPGVCDRRVEDSYRRRWRGTVAGVDEAGRGPWAGPVVTAAVVLTDADLPDCLTDSKQLTAEEREACFEAICRDHHVAVASASAALIDRVNIRAATLEAMGRALASLPVPLVGVLVDGRDVPPAVAERGLKGAAIVKGDAHVAAIAAASVIAKVTRDRMMRAYAGHYPLYGFERHMGYGTPGHRTALLAHGPCPIHRMSFRPLRSDGEGEEAD
ncbi:ribonuclease HII [Chthonobacter rhizosphaerae]|uniref:ribonuclease HII n=1 Tax=Chthonobacter rhizosphaerae TaxID=2735553 RepID=UPI0015EEA826|nr:ribonuclease HII [Chthonobacter rhizosphaerae]